jgi:MFS transporter, PAT family, beta-lactamase induction signal transducer AmpG
LSESEVTPPQAGRESWRVALLNRRMLICLFAGFSSGLPLFFLLTLVPAWLRSEHVELKAIGLFALIQFPYNIKFLWAPLLDRYAVPVLGRRRGWSLVAQLLLLVSLPLFGFLNPASDLRSIAVLAATVAFFSATQDIVLDAYRRELLSEQELGLGTSLFVNAYRLAGLVPGSLALILADHLPWDSVFMVTALFMLPGIVTSLAIAEPKLRVQPPRTLRQAVVEPFVEFVTRAGWRPALLMLAFVLLYKLGDSMATALATPFYLDMGFSKTEIGLIAKNAGLWPNILGALIGGIWMVKLGINRALWIFGVVQVVSILGFALLSQFPHDRVMLAITIGFEALGVGLGTVALLAFIARATNPAYTATQFALFTSLAVIPRVMVNATTGWMVERLGWFDFFLLCTALAVPGMLLLTRVAPWNGEVTSSRNPQ